MALQRTLDRSIRWEAEDGSPARTVTVGLLADPGLPTEIARALAADLPGMLADQPRDGMRYSFTVVSETLLRRGDDRGERLIDLAAERRDREGWDFAICLTDLPVHGDGRPLVAELSRDGAAALIVVPALIGLAVSYLVLFVGNLLTGWFVVVPQVFSTAIGRPAEYVDYVRLGWLASSLATIGGALGSALESTDTVRSATWGTRYRKAGRRHRRG